jgi:hypothetical protein
LHGQSKFCREERENIEGKLCRQQTVSPTTTCNTPQGKGHRFASNYTIEGVFWTLEGVASITWRPKHLTHVGSCYAPANHFYFSIFMKNTEFPLSSLGDKKKIIVKIQKHRLEANFNFFLLPIIFWSFTVLFFPIYLYKY